MTIPVYHGGDNIGAWWTTDRKEAEAYARAKGESTIWELYLPDDARIKYLQTAGPYLTLNYLLETMGPRKLAEHLRGHYGITTEFVYTEKEWDQWDYDRAEKEGVHLVIWLDEEDQPKAYFVAQDVVWRATDSIVAFNYRVYGNYEVIMWNFEKVQIIDEAVISRINGTDIKKIPLTLDKEQ